MSTPTVTPEAPAYARQFGRYDYRNAARRVRAARRQWSPETADAQRAAFAAMFAEDAARAGVPEHFDAEMFAARTQLLSPEDLAAVKAAKHAAYAALASADADLADDADSDAEADE